MQNQIQRVLTIAFLVFVHQWLGAQMTSSGWVASISGSGGQLVSDLVTDMDENVYTIGNFDGTTDFGGTMMSASGERDIYVTKHTSEGELVWVQKFGGTENDLGFSLDISATGEIYAVGFFEGTAVFDANTSLTSAGREDMFIAKLSSDGTLIWAKRIGGSSVDEANAVAIDQNGDIYVVGRFVGTVDFDPGAGTENLQSFGGPDAFVLKLSGDGAYLWAHDFGASGNEECEMVRVDSENNVVITGLFSGVTDFDPGPQEFELFGDGLADPFYLKLDPAGSFIWARSFTSTGFVYSADLDIDGDNNIVAHGYFSGDINFDPDNPGGVIPSIGAEDAFTVKMDPNGSVIWSNIIGGSSIEFGYGVAVDVLGDVYVTGFYYDDPAFDPIGGTVSLPSAGIEDTYIVKYDRDGGFVWAKRTGGSSSDAGYGIDISPAGDVLIAGNYWGTSDLDPEQDEVLNLQSDGLADIFILKIDQLISSVDHSGPMIDVSVSPNPSTDVINITSEFQFPLHATLMNTMGAQIRKTVIDQNAQTINLQTLPSGVYYLILDSGKGMITRKIVKM